ncbi:MAG: hypothetical protein ABIJ43_01210 [Candidatus Beckwithbacteria bacterium]|nr:hypothetical protein [Patescibacteria group bacterium]
MKLKLSMIFVFLLLIFSFVLVGEVRAGWLIDGSGTLVEVDSLALDLGEENEVMIAEMDINDSTDKPLVKGVDRAKKLNQDTDDRKKQMKYLNQSIQSKIEVEEGRIRVQQEVKNKDGYAWQRKNILLPQSEILNIKRPDGKSMRISVNEENKLEIDGAKLKTKTSSALGIGEDNKLVVTRKDNLDEVINYYPDVAKVKLEEEGIKVISENAELDSEKETLVYRFETEKKKRLFGIFPFYFKNLTDVSTETGEEVESILTETSTWRKILSKLSF